MSARAIFFSFFMIFIAFVLEHLPLPVVVDWFQPAWVMLCITALVLFAPNVFGLWLAIPLGLMMDVEQGTLFGLHVVMVTVHILMLQILYRRMFLFNVLQQAIVIMLLIAMQQLIHYWGLLIINGDSRPVLLWMPAFMSAILWPWVYTVGYKSLRRMQH